jgi:hypothetical protein
MRVCVIAIGAIAAVSGCVSLPKYEAPSSGTPSAVLTVRNHAIYGKAALWPYSDTAHCKGPLDAGATSDMKFNGRAEILVKAGDDLSLGMVQVWRVGNFCNADATFHPESGRRYVVDLVSDLINGCAIMISREESRNGQVRISPEPSFRVRKVITPIYGGHYCE